MTPVIINNYDEKRYFCSRDRLVKIVKDTNRLFVYNLNTWLDLTMIVTQASERMSNVDRSNSNSWKIIYTM